MTRASISYGRFAAIPKTMAGLAISGRPSMPIVAKPPPRGTGCPMAAVCNGVCVAGSSAGSAMPRGTAGRDEAEPVGTERHVGPRHRPIRLGSQRRRRRTRAGRIRTVRDFQRSRRLVVVADEGEAVAADRDGGARADIAGRVHGGREALVAAARDSEVVAARVEVAQHHCTRGVYRHRGLEAIGGPREGPGRCEGARNVGAPGQLQASTRDVVGNQRVAVRADGDRAAHSDATRIDQGRGCGGARGVATVGDGQAIPVEVVVADDREAVASERDRGRGGTLRDRADGAVRAERVRAVEHLQRVVAREDGNREAVRADRHGDVGADMAVLDVRRHDACGRHIACVCRPGLTRQAGGALHALHALRPGRARRTRRALRPHRALRPRRTARAGGALRACRSAEERQHADRKLAVRVQRQQVARLRRPGRVDVVDPIGIPHPGRGGAGACQQGEREQRTTRGRDPRGERYAFHRDHLQACAQKGRTNP